MATSARKKSAPQRSAAAKKSAPASGEYIEFTSQYPEDLDHALDLLADAQ